VIERINSSPETTTSRRKRVNLDIEEEDESSDTNHANEDSCIPQRKKAKFVPVKAWNQLHLDFVEIYKQHDKLSKENQKIKQQLEQANRKSVPPQNFAQKKTKQATHIIPNTICTKVVHFFIVLLLFALPNYQVLYQL